MSVSTLHYATRPSPITMHRTTIHHLTLHHTSIHHTTPPNSTPHTTLHTLLPPQAWRAASLSSSSSFTPPSLSSTKRSSGPSPPPILKLTRRRTSWWAGSAMQPCSQEVTRFYCNPSFISLSSLCFARHFFYFSLHSLLFIPLTLHIISLSLLLLLLL